MIIGSGVDITEVRRMRQAVERWGDDFLKRIFTKKELTYAQTRTSLYQHLAGRFAAKEAVFKAVGDKNLSWQDVQVFNDKEGRPYCLITDGQEKRLRVHVSISHVKTYAVAAAVAEKMS